VASGFAESKLKYGQNEQKLANTTDTNWKLSAIGNDKQRYKSTCFHPLIVESS
jgi:hypothetical protein